MEIAPFHNAQGLNRVDQFVAKKRIYYGEGDQPG